MYKHDELWVSITWQAVQDCRLLPVKHKQLPCKEFDFGCAFDETGNRRTRVSVDAIKAASLMYERLYR